MLISAYDANTKIRDKEGKTPLDYVEDEAIKQQLCDVDSRSQQSLPVRATKYVRFKDTGIEFFSSVSEQEPSTTSADTLRKEGQ